MDYIQKCVRHSTGIAFIFVAEMERIALLWLQGQIIYCEEKEWILFFQL